MIQWRRLMLGFLLALMVAPALTGSASATVPELDVTFESSGATSDFPKGITFTLDYDTDEEVDRAELFYTTSGEETLNLITTPINDEVTGEVSYLLDLQIYYLPPGVDLVYFWRLTGDDGEIAETERSVVTWFDSRFAWESIETEDVRVSTYDGDEGFAQAILDSAQAAVDEIQVELDAELDEQVRIWAYRSTEDFSGTQAPNSEQWIAGVAFPSLKVILAVLPTGDTTEVGRVIPHEISHQVIHQDIENPYNDLPTWLDEGVAVTYQENGYDHFPALVQEAADQGALFSVRSLNSGFPYDGGGATLGYAESYSIVSFIRERWGEEALANLINSYKAGISHDEAALNALGVDLDELDRLWKESLDYEGDSGTAGVVDGGGDAGGSSGWDDLLASGALIWVIVAMLAIAVSIRSLRRNRAATDDDDFELRMIAPR